MKKIILLSLSLIISFSFFANAEPTKKFGARYWHSEGETELSHCASLQCGGGSFTPITHNGVTYSSYGDPTSQLTYSDTKAKVLEFFGDFSLPQNDDLIFSFKLGSGSGDGGSFRDKDWVLVPGTNTSSTFSDTLSDTRDTKVDYHVLDFGRVYSFNKYSLKPFFGYFKYEEELNAYGLEYLDDELQYYGGGSRGIDSSLVNTKVIKNEITWTGIRIGTEYINSITDKANFIINAAYVYDAEADNEDSHVLRTSPADLGPVPNILGDGDGDGVMLDVIGEINQTDRLNFSFGYRYWKLESDNSTTAFGPDFSPKFPGRSLYSERSGLIASVSYNF
jgi:hypothetical protein